MCGYRAAHPSKFKRERYALHLSGMEQQLEGRLAELLRRHLESTARVDWSYHSLLPWERGRNFIREPWRPEQAVLSPAMYTAVETALLTEVNLPWFTTYLSDHFRRSLEVLQDFVRNWTAEESQHANLLETYLLLTRSGDPDQLHTVRKEVLTQGFEVPDLHSAFEVMVYTSIQELATRAFYLNVAGAGEREDPDLARILRRLAKDETLHYAFYRDAVKAHLEVNPNYVWPLVKVLIQFQMPGANMPDFDQRMKIIAQEAGYGPAQYYRQVIGELVRYWDLYRLHPTYAEAQEALDRLRHHEQRLGRVIERLERRGPKRPAAIGDGALNRRWDG